jgi:hypothetical protein
MSGQKLHLMVGHPRKRLLNHPIIIRSSAPHSPRNCRRYFSLPFSFFFSSDISQLFLYHFYSIYTMSAPGAGHEFPRQEVSWQKRDVLLFANSIGVKADELHFLYVSFMSSTLNRSSHWFLGTSPQLRRLPYLLSHPAYVQYIPGFAAPFRANIIRSTYQPSSSPTKK